MLARRARNGNLKKRIDVNQGSLTEEFFYDALNRLDYSQLGGVTNLNLTLDAIGNITAKTSATDPAENVGTYTYHATKKHAVVSTSNGWSFGYDANGNMNSYKGNSIVWTSYNLPSTINAAGYSSQFFYGPNRNRWKQVASYASGTETTIYVGGILEKLTTPSGTAYRHYIGAGSAKVLYTRWSTGQISTKYVTSDHLGSSTVVMDSAGAALVNLSFASYGARRDKDWSGPVASGDMTQISNATRRGYTGHEHLDNMNLVHMNGRVFEPTLGRFLSADPFMPGSLGSQAPNRYAYVGNRALSLIDPSGFGPKQGFTLYSPITGMSPGEMDVAMELIKEIYELTRIAGESPENRQLVADALASSNDPYVQSLSGAFGGPSNGSRGGSAGAGDDGGATAATAGPSRGNTPASQSAPLPPLDCPSCLEEVVVSGSRVNMSETITWTPGRAWNPGHSSSFGPRLGGTGYIHNTGGARPTEISGGSHGSPATTDGARQSPQPRPIVPGAVGHPGDIPIPIRVGQVTTATFAVIGGAKGLLLGLDALAAFEGGGILIFAEAASAPGAYAMVGTLTGAGIGVTVGLAFGFGWLIGTGMYVIYEEIAY